MKRIVVLAMFFWGVVGLAAPIQYDIKAQLFKGDKLVASPHIITLAEEPATIGQANEDASQEMRINVMAEPDAETNKDGILVKMHVLYREDSQTWQSTSAVATQAGKEESVTITGADGQPKMIMKFRAIPIDKSSK